VLDRALDVAATLEVRGYGGAHQRARGRPHLHREAWSRHDLEFMGSALVVLAIALAARIAGWGAFNAYPLLRAPAGARTLEVAALLVLAALAPFADRRGIVR
jgi:energy-coupling factor transport system permease protein